MLLSRLVCGYLYLYLYQSEPDDREECPVHDHPPEG